MDRRDSNREHAAAHIKEMETLFGKQIKSSVKNSVIYGGSGKMPQKGDNQNTGAKAETLVLNVDSTEAVLQYPGAALLNFASYRKAGGGFVNGAWAQEEAICHDSTLFNVISHFNGFYAENENNLNRSLYTDRAIFSPGVVFSRGGKTAECSVITCAAPNLSSAYSHGVTASENETALRQRVDFVISIAEEQGCDTVILGAWGCGVFGQNPAVMARLFGERLEETAIKLAVFAIPGQKDNKNYTSFLEAFSR